MADDVELRSAYLMHQFPESGGVVRGKKELIDYLNWLFHEFEETVSSHYELDQRNDYLIVRAISDTGALRYYLHYYFNNDNLICLIKSNLTRTKNY